MDDGCFDSIEQINTNDFLTPETSVTCLCNEDGCNDGDTDTIKLYGELSESRSCTILLFK